MRVKLKHDSILEVIGDPHFGRKFINGVPIHRRGEREALQTSVFKELMGGFVEGVDAVVMMGDLFDKFAVEENVLLHVYEIIAEASWNNPDIMYFMLQGNHDVSRDNEVTSSLDILERMLAHRNNVVFVRHPHLFETKKGDKLLMFPYDAFTKAADLVRTEKFFGVKDVSAAFGHWDIEDFGNDHNLIPVSELKDITQLIFTGHVHSYKTYNEGDVKVIVVGSMMPYAHGEDQNEMIYVTHTLEEYLKNTAQNPKFYHHKALRLLIKKGEEVPTDLDVLQFSYKFIDDKNEEETEVKTEIFSFKELFDSCMADNGVSKNKASEVWSKYMEKTSNAKEA